MARPILTVETMRAAEAAAIDRGTSVETLMERAGSALAQAVVAYAGKRPVLVLCGPGNNGGDGYVAAACLRDNGIEVRLAASADPSSAACRWAKERWDGEVSTLANAEPTAVLVDCLFGTGLSRGLDAPTAQRLNELAEQSRIVVAADLPSGVSSDDGRLLSAIPSYDLTLTFGALKPAHRLAPAVHRMGRVVLADIGIEADGRWFEIAAPALPPLDPDGHKYDRGLVHCLAGTMPGAIALSASAAARSGAGYVRVSTSQPIAGLPESIVQTGTASLSDPRIGCVLVGPGLGDVPAVLTLALTSRAPKVIDADAIGLIGDPQRLHGQDAILTPHAGEFATLFGESDAPKTQRALDAARESQSVIVFKGSDTLVAAPDGRLGFAPPAPAWLASAGTGDVLAGIIAAMRARGLDAFAAACAGAWVHGRAAEQAGPAMIADDLIDSVASVLP